MKTTVATTMKKMTRTETTKLTAFVVADGRSPGFVGEAIGQSNVLPVKR